MKRQNAQPGSNRRASASEGNQQRLYRVFYHKPPKTVVCTECPGVRCVAVGALGPRMACMRRFDPGLDLDLDCEAG